MFASSATMPTQLSCYCQERIIALRISRESIFSVMWTMNTKGQVPTQATVCWLIYHWEQDCSVEYNSRSGQLSKSTAKSAHYMER